MRLSPIDGWIIASIGQHERSCGRAMAARGCRPRCWDCKLHAATANLSGSPRPLRLFCFFFVVLLFAGWVYHQPALLAARVFVCHLQQGPATSAGCCITRLGPSVFTRHDRPPDAPVQSGHPHLFARLVLLVSHLQDVIAPPGFAAITGPITPAPTCLAHRLRFDPSPAPPGKLLARHHLLLPAGSARGLFVSLVGCS